MGGRFALLGILVALGAGALAGCLSDSNAANTHLVTVDTYYAGPDDVHDGARAVNGTLSVTVIDITAWEESANSSNGTRVEVKEGNGSAGFATASADRPRLLTPPTDRPARIYWLDLGEDGRAQFLVPADPPIRVDLIVRGKAPPGEDCKERLYTSYFDGQDHEVTANVTRDLMLETPFRYSCHDDPPHPHSS